MITLLTLAITYCNNCFKDVWSDIDREMSKCSYQAKSALMECCFTNQSSGLDLTVV